jgi:serine/threonine protein kinase
LVGGKINGRLEVKALLGAGCYGHAYRAEPIDGVGGDEVCVKVFPSRTANVPNDIAKCASVASKDFEVARQLEAAGLGHPNICKVVHVTDPGKPERITVYNKYPDGREEPRVHGALHYIEMEACKCELFLYCSYRQGKTDNQLQATCSTKMSERFARRIFRQMLQGFAYLHDQGYCHNDVKSDNMAIARCGDAYELKLIDFGSWTKMSSNHLISKDEAAKGFNRNAPEVPNPFDAKQLGKQKICRTCSPDGLTIKALQCPCPVDGRKADLFGAATVLDWLVGSSMVGIKVSREVKALIALMKDTDPITRPLAADILDPKFKPADGSSVAHNWLCDASTREEKDTATNSELIDELESRVYSIDQLHDKYTTRRRVVTRMAASGPAQAGTEPPIDGTAVFNALRDALKALEDPLAGGDLVVTGLYEDDRLRITHESSLKGGPSIATRLVVKQKEVYSGETLRPRLGEMRESRKLPGGQKLAIPKLKTKAPENHPDPQGDVSIPDGPFELGQKVELGGIKGIDVVGEVKAVFDNEAADWNTVPKRTVIEVTLSYLSGRDAQAYEAWLSVVEGALSRFDPPDDVHRETLTIKAFALLKWLRMIVCSAYVRRQSVDGELLNNFVPVFIGKLGEMLAALQKVRTGTDGRFGVVASRIDAALTATNVAEPAVVDGLEVDMSMLLSPEMVLQMAKVYDEALYSADEHFKMLEDLRRALVASKPATTPATRHWFEWQRRIKDALVRRSTDDNYFHDVDTTDNGGLGHTFVLRPRSQKSDPTCTPPTRWPLACLRLVALTPRRIGALSRRPHVAGRTPVGCT